MKVEKNLNDKLRDTKLIYDLDKIEEKEEFAFQLDWGKIDTPEGLFNIIDKVDVRFYIEKNSEGFLIKGNVKTKLELECSRCLNKYNQNIIGEIEAYYINSKLSDKYTKNEKLDSLDNIIFFDESKVDVTDRIIESILMEIPEKPLCGEDCKGLCAVCGIDLNENPDHKHEEEYIDPRFAKLLDIFNEEK
ncbi:DUF177 domain-containing protein [Marinitoga sp. 38H-ov]|uniref:YceD family protein n=1 Tax=Marinitoga sp. 38H-ov TaxID=1755814 RepID=UPI0013EB84D4|nr:DUF177 domain-containing protein [Marinitoga sp. 38H-ov]KAF2956062.1 hypothetical protein AS160_07830 [Marinitoga sp. 38H-ov]